VVFPEKSFQGEWQAGKHSFWPRYPALSLKMKVWQGRAPFLDLSPKNYFFFN
jgi:hypothetical protein